ncbi:hypothetical protein BT96DRAFT_934026 [Gymnopus androsaceus JB14]|uniref:Cupin type-2 domain-containing protein n=1 Tax=Gymnopus androsaceus JB14 TaxID=1447944 RepID=A0A6A4I767_9AGAR|nr:hypothetical protein BT96DRAFT_934026 [Gymnopus androsaceus JB14]
MSDYPDTVVVAQGVIMTFQDQIRTVTVSGRIGESLSVPAHWHEKHDEVICVLEGQLSVTIGSEAKIYTPETGDAYIPKGVVHSIRSLEGIPCVYTEKTNPAHEKEFDAKELFFRNAFSRPRGGLLSVMQIFYHGDMFPVFPVVHSMWMEKAFVTLLGGYIAPCLGYRLKYTKLKKMD